MKQMNGRGTVQASGMCLTSRDGCSGRGHLFRRLQIEAIDLGLNALQHGLHSTQTGSDGSHAAYALLRKANIEAS